MATRAIPLDVKSAEERLMRFLSVEGVTGQEEKIAAAVSDDLKKVGVPAAAIKFDDAQQAHSGADRNGKSHRRVAGYAARAATAVRDTP